MREVKFGGFDTCTCRINIQFDDETVGEPIWRYATQAVAQDIRRERHEFFVAKHTREGDQPNLLGRLRKYAAWTTPGSPQFDSMAPTFGPEHAMLPEDDAFLNNLLDENRRKNIGVEIIRLARADLAPRDIQFSFSGNGTSRLLSLSYPPQGDDLQTFQAQMDLQFGPDKVVLAAGAPGTGGRVVTAD